MTLAARTNLLTARRRAGGEVYPPITDGLVHWLPYTTPDDYSDHVTGTTIGSLAGNAYVGGTPCGLQLDGSGDYHLFNKWMGGRQKLSIMWLCKRLTTAHYSAIANMENFAFVGWEFYKNQSYAYCADGLFGISTAFVGTYQHAAMVFDGTLAQNDRIKVYIDGAPWTVIGRPKLPGTTAGSVTQCIGGRPTQGIFTGGRINHALFYAVALTAEHLVTLSDWSYANV